MRQSKPWPPSDFEGTLPSETLLAVMQHIDLNEECGPDCLYYRTLERHNAGLGALGGLRDIWNERCQRRPDF